MEIILWVILLNLFCERPIPPGIHALDLCLAGDRSSDGTLQAPLRTSISESTGLCECSKPVSHHEALTASPFPSVVFPHLSTHNAQNILRVQIVPHSVCG